MIVLQQVVVGIVALGALAFIVRRVVQAARPDVQQPGCEACAMHESPDPPPTSTSR